jgi:hypothetical protein
LSNTTGNFNTAHGRNALVSNSTGSGNTANGINALLSNTTGVSNSAHGTNALQNNTTGSNNTATGDVALVFNTTGVGNTADGQGALYNNISGFNNIALGINAGSNLTTGSLNIDIGNTGVAAENNTIRIGTQGTQTATFVAGINGFDASAGLPVFILPTGQLGTGTFSVTSAPPNPKNSMASKRTIARYQADNVKLRTDLDRQEAKIAELKSLVAKQQTTIAQQRKDSQTTFAQQQKEIKALTASLKEQASKIQKVSDEVELNKPAPQTAANK